ncbi:MAG: PrpF domain-containing protein [Geminicoccaceae bacterium]
MLRKFSSRRASTAARILLTISDVSTTALPENWPIEASLVAAGNPFVFVPAPSLGLAGSERPRDIGADRELMDRLELIRRAASVMMGISPDLAAAAAIGSIPKIAILAPARESPTLSGRILQPDEADILSRAISVGQPDNGIPLTGALCLASACRIPETVAERLAGAAPSAGIRTGLPSRTKTVDAAMRRSGGQFVGVDYATVFRAARRLFAGEVYVRTVLV